jgi:hypothetical protein
MLSNAQLYELSHYMKEDVALSFGVCASVLACVRCVLLPTAPRWAALGAACALAVSGKYLGALSLLLLPACLVLVGKSRRAAWWSLPAFLLVFGLVNFPMLGAFGEFSANLGREMDYAVSGHKGLTREVPHGVYGAVFREATNPAIWILLIGFAVSLVAPWFPRGNARILAKKPHSVLWVLVGFCLLYTLILSFSPKTHHRYFLPVTCLLLMFAAMAPFRFGRVGLGVGMLIFVLAFALSVARLVEYDRGFGNDPRQALVAYVSKQLPEEAIIAQDKRVGLPVEGDRRFEGSGMRVPQRVMGKLFAADVGSLEEMWRFPKGITAGFF